MNPTNSRSVWRPILATLIFHLCCFAWFVHRTGGNLEVFVCAGTERAALPEYRGLRTFIGLRGYDGQCYYVLAQSPISRQSNLAIDAPATRQSRILYPL